MNEEQGCYFCNSEDLKKSIHGEKYMYMVDEFSNLLGTSDGCGYFTINYCPICGRRLSEKDA